MSGKLYVVGTPIGNLGDMSPRAVKTLETADFIAAEDTRVTVKLLNHFGISTPLLSYHEHNHQLRDGEICDRIANGEICALVTDAGMPAISDPGEALVRMCRERQLPVESVPGPTAFATALAISGMFSGRFTFEGFLSVAKQARKQHLDSLRREERTMIFYEAPHKLPGTLHDMLDVLGDRNIALVREITKIHEEAERTTLSAAAAKYDEVMPMGEFVVIVEGAEKLQDKDEYTIEDAVNIARRLTESGSPASYAAKEAAAMTGFRKGDIYKLLIG